MFTIYYMQVKILMSDLNKQCGRRSLAPTHAIPLQITRSMAFKIFHSGHASDLNVHWRCLISGIVQILFKVIIKTKYKFWLKHYWMSNTVIKGAKYINKIDFLVLQHEILATRLQVASHLQILQESGSNASWVNNAMPLVVASFSQVCVCVIVTTN